MEFVPQLLAESHKKTTKKPLPLASTKKNDFALLQTTT